MIVGIDGSGRKAAFARAVQRFDTLLDELVAELPRLRRAHGPAPKGETARIMHRATQPFAPQFITPMAAVAGAGAETILRAICDGPGITRAYVNNGGDVAFHLSEGQVMRAALATTPPGHALTQHTNPVRGIATSGWQGRSYSLGIADAVTVLAPGAAMADAAATMIANATDLPGHPAIIRQPAHDLAPDSDLGSRPVTTHVGPLSDHDKAEALTAGATYTQTLIVQGLIVAAILSLQGAQRIVGSSSLIQQKDPEHA
jgi:ApbE superfamily uncharacterized protein (UPF0280 family)